MKIITKILLAMSVFALCLFVTPLASADDSNKKTTVTFSEPFEVPGTDPQVLPAGTYVFKIIDSFEQRHIVRIFNKDETHIYTTILAIANYRLRPTSKTVMTFKERAQGEPPAIRAWFYPGRHWGEEFVYPKAKALELAKIDNQPVLYMPAEVTTVEAFQTAPIIAVKPTGEDVPLAQVVEAPPAEVAAAPVAPVAEAQALPKTGSQLPLVALLGLLSLGVAAGITKRKA